MKYLVIIALIAAFFTNPDLQMHKNAVLDKVRNYLDNQVSDKNDKWVQLGDSLAMKFSSQIIDKVIYKEDYVFFSITKIRLNGGEKNIGLGAFGNIFLNEDFGKLDFKEAFSSDQNDNDNNNNNVIPKSESLGNNVQFNNSFSFSNFVVDPIEKTMLSKNYLVIYPTYIHYKEIPLFNDKVEGKTNDFKNTNDLDKGLVMYLPFSGNSNDYSANGNDGVVHGATLTTDRHGNKNMAYNFDGISNYISLPLLTKLNGLRKASFSFWVKTDVSNNSGAIFGHFGNSNGAIGANPGVFIGTYMGNEIMFSNYTGVSGVSSSPISINGWHHVVIVFDGDESSSLLKVKFYIDNSLKGSSVVQVNNAIGVATSSYIGRRNIDFDDYGDYFKGQLDEVRVYDRVLDTSEIANLYLQ